MTHKQTELSSSGTNVIYYNCNNGPQYIQHSGIYKMFGEKRNLFTDSDLNLYILLTSYPSHLLGISDEIEAYKFSSSLDIPPDVKIKSNLFAKLKNREA